MDKTPYVPTVLLRCSKCDIKTPHVLIDLSNDPNVAITLTYECQECGERKKIFDLNTLQEVVHALTENIAATAKGKGRPIPIERGAEIDQPIPIEKGP